MAARIGWTINYDGHAFAEGDLTVADALRACEIAGCSWVDLHPLAGLPQFVGLLAAFLMSIGEDEKAALEKVGALRMVDAFEMVTPGG